uniref:Palmitoyltransferase n=1 Tax=Alexandrium monilatum TaxID=311494 RepID=A0A7S4QL39_9DINO
MVPLEVEAPPAPSQPARPSRSRGPGARSSRPADPEPPEPPPLEIARALAAEWASAGRRPLVHEVWSRLGFKGRLRCGGRCVTGPPVVDFKFNVCTWVTILLPSAFYFWACGPELWEWCPLVPVCTALLLLTTVALLLLTSCTDPGIVPRPVLQLLVEDLEQEVQEAIGCSDWPTDTSRTAPDPEIRKQLEPLGFDWCRHCRMWQPPRAKHCRDCGCCVLRNDHHCPFVNNCIGQRNYAFFCAMLFTGSCLGVAVLGGISVWWGSTQDDPDKSTQMLMSALVVGPTSAVVLGLVGLVGFHAVLVCRGRTTREALTGRIRGNGPTLWTVRGPSLLPTRREVHFPPMEV